MDGVRDGVMDGVHACFGLRLSLSWDRIPSPFRFSYTSLTTVLTKYETQLLTGPCCNKLNTNETPHWEAEHTHTLDIPALLYPHCFLILVLTLG